MFNAAQSVLDKTESLLVNQKFKNRIMKRLGKFVGHPFSFLMLGMDNLFKPLPMMSAVFFGFMIVSMPAVYFLQDNPDTRHVIFYIACLVTFIVTIFALPSTFSMSGVQDEDVDIVTSYFCGEGIETVSDVELLEQNFEFVFQRIYSRIKFYQIAIGTLWAFYMYYFNFGVMLWVKGGMKEDTSLMGDHLFSLICALLLTLLSFTIVLAYKRANERLIKTIQFACVQVKYDLAE
ncbi:hypothetical protein CW745_13955 [Psychromonas sp. psych-6C06]|uniref:hypothetical protein n=1 Tax=Psychromonas sp. psych-6C06 TaxID=2058089 RepID=UPI000C33CEC7|nr:hypothetical protein [Psychromonas sp. psych-6C06]PKF60630.1 hypothetical protein CW745_13955 [Psychromonas sp. psych-6C06]